MVFGVTRLQLQQLRLQVGKLLFEGLRVSRGLGRPPCRQLLRQHRLGIGLVLLSPVQGLGIRFQLRVQSHQNLQVVFLLARKLPHILLLEVGQLGFQIVQIALGIIQTLAEEVGRTPRHVLARFEVLLEQQRGQLVADLLRLARA